MSLTYAVGPTLGSQEVIKNLQNNFISKVNFTKNLHSNIQKYQTHKKSQIKSFEDNGS